MTSPTAALLREAVERFKAGNPDVDENAQSVLDRLVTSEDDRAAESVAEMTDDPATVDRVLLCCIGFEAVYRLFPEIVARETKMLRRLDKLLAAAKELDGFIVELATGPQASFIDAWIALAPGRDYGWRVALSDISGHIKARRRVAKETPLRLGWTRKSRTEDAREIAALGWLAEGIEKLCGQPHYHCVAMLAEVILQREEVVDGNACVTHCGPDAGEIGGSALSPDSTGTFTSEKAVECSDASDAPQGNEAPGKSPEPSECQT
jgi:hypothetical protein